MQPSRRRRKTDQKRVDSSRRREVDEATPARFKGPLSKEAKFVLRQFRQLCDNALVERLESADDPLKGPGANAGTIAGVASVALTTGFPGVAVGVAAIEIARWMGNKRPKDKGFEARLSAVQQLARRGYPIEVETRDKLAVVMYALENRRLDVLVECLRKGTALRTGAAAALRVLADLPGEPPRRCSRL